MTLAERVLAEFFSQNSQRAGRPKELSDEMLALCAVLDREGIVVTKAETRYADGSAGEPTARPRRKGRRAE